LLDRDGHRDIDGESSGERSATSAEQPATDGLRLRRQAPLPIDVWTCEKATLHLWTAGPRWRRWTPMKTKKRYAPF